MFNNMKRFFQICLIIFYTFIKVEINAQVKYGLTDSQIAEMQKNADEVVKNFYSSLSSIGVLSSDSNNIIDVKKIRSDVLKSFENEKVNVFNDLIDSGSTYMEIERYLTTLSSVYCTFPGDIIAENFQKSTVFIKDSSFYVVKVSFLLTQKGMSISKTPIYKRNTLDVFLKYSIKNNIYDAPLIYFIMPSSSKESQYGMTEVDIVRESSLSSNAAQISELQTRINNSTEMMNKMKAETDLIKNNYEKMLNNLNDKEYKLQMLESQLKVNENLINQKMDELKEKEDEINIKTRQLNKQKEDNIRQLKQIEDKDNEIKRKDEEFENKLKSIEINQFSSRNVMEFGFGFNSNIGTIESNINGIINNEIDYSSQIRAMIGHRFDFRKNNSRKAKMYRGSVIGVFMSYTLNSSKNIKQTVSNQNFPLNIEQQLPIYNRSLDVEVGFVFNELLRISGGIGNMNGYMYNVATTALKIPFGKYLNCEIGSSFLFGKDYKKTQINPYISLFYQLNDKIAMHKKDFNSSQLCTFQFSNNILFNAMTQNSMANPDNAYSYASDLYWGFNLSSNYNLGFIGTVGNFNKGFTNEILSNYRIEYDTLMSNYNPYFHVNLGMYFNNKIKFSYGIGKLFIDNTKAIQFHSITLGGSFLIFKKIKTLRFNIDLSSKFLNNDMEKILFSFSSGISFRFPAFRYGN